MEKSIFAELCDITDTLSTYTHDFPEGPQRDKLTALVDQLDAVIDRTVGVKEIKIAQDMMQPEIDATYEAFWDDVMR